MASSSTQNYVVCVTVYVKPDNIDQFIAASHDNHVGTRTEPGNLRFDVLQHEEDKTRFFLYEVFCFFVWIDSVTG